MGERIFGVRDFNTVPEWQEYCASYIRKVCLPTEQESWFLVREMDLLLQFYVVC